MVHIWVSHLVEVGNLRNLIPQVAHYHGVTSEAESALDTILSTECENGCKNTGQRGKNSKKIILTESESEIPTNSCPGIPASTFFRSTRRGPPWQWTWRRGSRSHSCWGIRYCPGRRGSAPGTWSCCPSCSLQPSEDRIIYYTSPNYYFPARIIGHTNTESSLSGAYTYLHILILRNRQIINTWNVAIFHIKKYFVSTTFYIKLVWNPKFP